MYNVDWNRFVLINLPWHKRQPVRIAWLSAIISQVEVVHNWFYTLWEQLRYDVQFNGQIIYLEHVLNDRFDNTNRGIYIENVADINRTWIYNKIETKPTTYFYNKYRSGVTYVFDNMVISKGVVWRCLSTTTSIPASGNPAWQYLKPKPYLKDKYQFITANDFIVWVPVSVMFDVNEMKALVNKYKLAGKRYSINTY